VLVSPKLHAYEEMVSSGSDDRAAFNPQARPLQLDVKEATGGWFGVPVARLIVNESLKVPPVAGTNEAWSESWVALKRGNPRHGSGWHPTWPRNSSSPDLRC
jgi:hypothetical protein